MYLSIRQWVLAIIAGLLIVSVSSPTGCAAETGQRTRAGTFRPDPVSVQRFGPGYRYPQAGWTMLHIEGEPYDRGFQHGRLMANEISEFIGELAAIAASGHPRTPGTTSG